MEILKNLVQVFFTSLGSIAVLFVLTKLIGNKQINQLNMFDYINGITIGSIAAEMATSLESDFLMPLLAMIIYAFTAFALSLISSRSLKARRFINGKSIMLFDNGKLYFDNFKKAKIDINEVLTQCRVKGYFDLSQVETVLLEANGSISVLPKGAFRPVNPSDLNICVREEKSPVNVIVGGEILEQNLRSAGRDKNWLSKNLRAQGVKNPGEVFLAYVNGENLEVFVKLTGDKTPQGDIFQ